MIFREIIATSAYRVVSAHRAVRRSSEVSSWISFSDKNEVTSLWRSSSDDHVWQSTPVRPKRWKIKNQSLTSRMNRAISAASQAPSRISEEVRNCNHYYYYFFKVYPKSDAERTSFRFQLLSPPPFNIYWPISERGHCEWDSLLSERWTLTYKIGIIKTVWRNKRDPLHFGKDKKSKMTSAEMSSPLVLFSDRW